MGHMKIWLDQSVGILGFLRGRKFTMNVCDLIYKHPHLIRTAIENRRFHRRVVQLKFRACLFKNMRIVVHQMELNVCICYRGIVIFEHDKRVRVKQRILINIER